MVFFYYSGDYPLTPSVASSKSRGLSFATSKIGIIRWASQACCEDESMQCFDYAKSCVSAKSRYVPSRAAGVLVTNGKKPGLWIAVRPFTLSS